MISLMKDSDLRVGERVGVLGATERKTGSRAGFDPKQTLPLAATLDLEKWSPLTFPTMDEVGRLYRIARDTSLIISSQSCTNASLTSIKVSTSDTSPSKKNDSVGIFTLNGSCFALAIRAS